MEKDRITKIDSALGYVRLDSRFESIKIYFRVKSKEDSDSNKSMSELNSSSSSLNASQWMTVLERTSPLENRAWFEDREGDKKAQSVPKQTQKPKDIETPKLMAKPVINNTRLVTAEEVLSSKGPDDWSKLTEFMRTRSISRPVRSRSEPLNIEETRNLPKKRKRLPTPE